MMAKNIFFTALIFISVTSADAANRIAGNTDTRNGNTFSFPIKKMLTTSDQRMIVAAHEGGAGNFAISYLDSGASQFKALAPEKIILNGQKDQSNPIFDAAIAHIAPLNSTNIAIMTADNQTEVYCHNFGLFKNHLFQTKPIMDATGTYPTSGITALAGGNGYAFVAVKGHDQATFGTGDSGIALIKFSEIYSEQELDQKALEKIKEDGKDLSDEEKQEIEKALYQDKDGKTKKKITTFGFAQANTFPLNNTWNILKVGDADVTIEEITDMYYSPALERVYVACKLKGSGSACAIAVGHVYLDGKLQLAPLVASYMSCDQKIVGAEKRHEMGTIRQIKTLQTSTGYLDYLIILADGPCGECTEVHAVPLLNLKQVDGTIDADDMLWHGTLAHKNSSLLEAYGPNNPKTGRSQFLGRHFNQLPHYSDDLFNDCDVPTRVGNGGFPVGPFENLSVQGDCVYVTLNEQRWLAYNVGRPIISEKGVYRSQAIFDHDGRIASWTQWERVHDSADHVAWYTIDGASGNAIISSGSDADSIRSLSRTGWNTELQDSVAQRITQEFPKENGGIQGLFDFPSLYHPYSLLCITGKEKVMLVPMHATSNPDEMRVFVSDTLKEIGAIVAAEVSFSYTDHLWIGGSGGLALLEQDNELNTISCTKIGNYSFVKKLIVDEQFLYVLTDTMLDRIDYSKSDFKNNQLVVAHLADAQQLLNTKYGFFYDCAVSGPLALLAHNKGLSRIANDHDVRVDDMQTIAWTDVPLTTSAKPVIALSCVSVTGRPQDVARHGSGQIYAVCGSKRERCATVYRLAVTASNEINDQMVVPLNDYVIKDQMPFYFNLKSYTSGFFTDGTLSFVTYNKMNKTPAHMATYYGALHNTVPIKINDASTITHMVRSSKTGKWLLAGDFGLVVNE
jgi:hypothetical protein